MRTQVAIVGAGPAGLLLGQLLHRAGIETLIVEKATPEQVLSRVRAGVLEQGTVELVRRAGAGANLDRHGIVHEGIEIASEAGRFRIDFTDTTNKRAITIYGQTELTRDLMAAREESGAETLYGVSDVRLNDIESERPSITFTRDGVTSTVVADFICGCDGSHGPSRQAIPAAALKTYEKTYPMNWLGVLADTPPVADELVYASSERGFALCSMRSRTRSRFYIQTAETDRAEDWTDEAFWDELRLRLPRELAEKVQPAPPIEKSVARLRSSVTEPLRFGKLFLCGDAGHIVPPTGAKGLNLAASDVHYLVEALLEHYEEHKSAGLDSYSRRALARVWKAERFCWWMTNLLHKPAQADPFEARLRVAELENLGASQAARAVLAENYVGIAF